MVDGEAGQDATSPVEDGGNKPQANPVDVEANRIEAKLLYYFSVKKQDVKYVFKVAKNFSDDETSDFFGKLLPRGPGHNLRRNLDPPPGPPPPYIVGIVSELVNQREIPKSFSFNLQYIVVGPNADGESYIAISYDVMFSGSKAIRGATFELLPENCGEGGFLHGQLLPVFKELTSGKIEGKIEDVASIPSKWLSAGFIDHEVEILGYDNGARGEISLKARCTTTFRRAPYGEYASAYGLPRFPRCDEDKMNPVVLAGYQFDETLKAPKVKSRNLSPIVQQNLEALELAMSVSNPKIVFVQGEPGSGKDGFASAIHSGSRLDLKRDKPAKFSSRSVAAMDLQQFRREVFGEEKDGVVVEGLIDKTKGGTVFLDEFDKLKKGADGAYAELLRVWEAKEFVPVNGRELIKADDINWVVAGAFTSRRATSDLPPDIWSRFSAQIAIQNPISSPFVKDADRSGYIQSLILSFMLGRAIEKCNPNGGPRSMRSLYEPKSRFDEVAGDLLFAGGKSGRGQRLEPSPIMILSAIALAKYLGMYWVFSLRCSAKGPPAKKARREEYCMPSLYVDRTPTKLNKVLPIDWVNPLALERYSRPFTMVDGSRSYDSVRAVRQACNVVFDRLFEIVIQRANSGGMVEQNQIQKLFNEAFTTIDLTRRGNGLERLLKHDHLLELRFGPTGVVSTTLLAAIAQQARSV